MVKSVRSWRHGDHKAAAQERRQAIVTLPEQNDPNLQFRVLPPARFAALRLFGLARNDNIDARIGELEKLAGTHRLRVVGSPMLSPYDPRWTLCLSRRSQAMLPVAI